MKRRNNEQCQRSAVSPPGSQSTSTKIRPLSVICGRMKRWDYAPYPLSAVPPPGTKVNASQRVPPQFIEAMKRLSSDVSTSHPPPAQKASSTAKKWKSSFHTLDGNEGRPEDRTADDSESSDQVHEPHCPRTSDCGEDTQQTLQSSRSVSSEDSTVECQRLSPASKPHARTRWDVPFQLKSKGSFPGQDGPDLDPKSHPGFDSSSQAACSPDRPHPESSIRAFPPSYEEPRSNGEERTAGPEYQRETISSQRSSPPRLQQDYQGSHKGTAGGGKQHPTASNQTTNRIKVVTDRAAVTCELCDVVLSNSEELDEHLDSKGHWDTLEHIQHSNKYDDVTVAFLQKVLLYKSRQYSSVLEEHALEALQENHHMTKVEMFHCAPCKALVFASAAEVKAHVSSQEHLANVKEFELQQRHLSLRRAEVILEALQPQFEIFLKGGTPFM